MFLRCTCLCHFRVDWCAYSSRISKVERLVDVERRGGARGETRRKLNVPFFLSMTSPALVSGSRLSLSKMDERFSSSGDFFLAVSAHLLLPAIACLLACPRHIFASARPMNCAAPFLKIVDHTSRQCYSRIPHLRAHIHSRRLGAASSCDRSCSPNPSSRHLAKSSSRRSSSSYSGDIYERLFADNSFREASSRAFLATKEKPNEASTSQNGNVVDQVPDTASGDSQAVAQSSSPLFYQTIAESHPEKVLFALNDPTQGTAFIQNADDETFSKAFEALDPALFINPYVQLYRNLDPHLHIQMRYRQCRSLEDRWNSFLASLDNFMGKRREAGHRLTLGVYRHLLKCAGAMGDEHLARDAFDVLMPEEEVEPDLQCFNHYMRARVWSAWFEVKFRNRTRVIQSNLDLRRHSEYSTRKRQQEVQGFRAHRLHPSPPEKIREVALKTFQELNRRGFSGNEETYVDLMLAMSQAGDLAAVKSVLKSVWNVNVDLLLQYDEEEIESPTYYEEDSPLRPSGLLLSTIVSIFANHNDISLAYTLLDFVSRNYNLQVPVGVWTQLYDITFVLCCKRGWGPGNQRYAARGEYNKGQLDGDTLAKFFDLITDEPHELKPTVVMLIMMARVQQDKRNLDRCLDYVRQALVALDEEKTNLSQLYDDLLTSINSRQPYSDDLSAFFLDRRHDFILQSMHVEKSLQYTLRMVYHVLQEHEWAGGGKLTDLAHRRIPELVKEFETFLPNELNYNTPTGHVRFINGMVHREYAIQLADDHFHARVGRLRQLLDTEDHGKLVMNVHAIPEILARRENWCFWCRKVGHHERDCQSIPRQLAGLNEEPQMHRLDLESTLVDGRDALEVPIDVDADTIANMWPTELAESEEDEDLRFQSLYPPSEKGTIEG